MYKLTQKFLAVSLLALAGCASPGFVAGNSDGAPQQIQTLYLVERPGSPAPAAPDAPAIVAQPAAPGSFLKSELVRYGRVK